MIPSKGSLVFNWPVMHICKRLGTFSLVKSSVNMALSVPQKAFKFRFLSRMKNEKKKMKYLRKTNQTSNAFSINKFPLEGEIYPSNRHPSMALECSCVNQKAVAEIKNPGAMPQSFQYDCRRLQQNINFAFPRFTWYFFSIFQSAKLG